MYDVYTVQIAICDGEPEEYLVKWSYAVVIHGAVARPASDQNQLAFQLAFQRRDKVQCTGALCAAAWGIWWR